MGKEESTCLFLSIILRVCLLIARAISGSFHRTQKIRRTQLATFSSQSKSSTRRLRPVATRLCLLLVVPQLPPSTGASHGHPPPPLPRAPGGAAPSAAATSAIGLPRRLGSASTPRCLDYPTSKRAAGRSPESTPCPQEVPPPPRITGRSRHARSFDVFSTVHTGCRCVALDGGV
jgi:hypothetical protein